MVQPISQDRACPKCLDDNVEKVGWNYWYCNSCTNIWEVVASAGKHSTKGSGTKPQTLLEKSSSERPDPGKFEIVKGLDFPLL